MNSRNEHHRFEDLCRAFARQMIAPNILPATGPVSAGGDQGRDFETFRTYLHARPGGLRAFCGTGGGDVLVFACTLQAARGIRGKIRKDVAAIVAGGGPVNTIYFFAEADIDKSVVHKLQEEVKGEHGIHLEVFDGYALSESLNTRETFWIAAEYLDVASAYMPAPGTDSPDWYTETHRRWVERRQPAATFGDLFDIAECVWFAIDSPDHVGDLEFWIDRLGPLLLSDNPDLVLAAQIEIIAARLRGQGDLRPAEQLWTELVTTAVTGRDPRRLARAVEAHGIALAAWFEGRTALSAQAVEDAARRVAACIEDLLGDEKVPSNRCVLLDSVAVLNMRVNPVRVRRGDENDAAADAGPIHAAVSDENDADASGSPVDPARALAAWQELLTILDAAPLFPIQQTSELINMWIAWLIDEPAWPQLVADLDTALNKFGSAQAAMTSSRRRVEALLAADRPAGALDELCRLHRHAVNAHEIRTTITALTQAAVCYQRLGLVYAAKHYALVATAMAGAQPDDYGDLTAEALIVVAHSEFLAGNWLSFLETFAWVVTAHGLWRPNATDPRAWDDINVLVMQVALIRQVAIEVGNPALLAAIDRRLAPAATNAERLPELITATMVEECCMSFAATTGQPMFADTGTQRIIIWSALGISVSIRCANGYEQVMIAERLTSALQAFQAASIGHEFLLAPAHLEISIAGTPAGQTPAEPIVWDTALGESGAARLTMHLQTWDPAVDPHGTAIATEVSNRVLDIFRALSLLDIEAIEETFRRMLDGLAFKTAPRVHYDAAFAMVPEENFDLAVRHSLAPLGEPAAEPPTAHSSIAAPQTPGPGFTIAKAEKLAQARYDTIPSLLNRTLPHLAATPQFHDTVTELRERGWKDWHLLEALADVVLGVRVADAADPVQATEELLSRTEGESLDDVLVAPELASSVVLQVALLGALPRTAQQWNLHPPRMPRACFNPAWLLDLLTERYGYATTDVEHDDPLIMTGSGPQA